MVFCQAEDQGGFPRTVLLEKKKPTGGVLPSWYKHLVLVFFDMLPLMPVNVNPLFNILVEKPHFFNHRRAVRARIRVDLGSAGEGDSEDSTSRSTSIIVDVARVDSK